jgi:hypothetical protein
VPGLVAVTPWLLLLAALVPEVRSFYETYSVLGNALLFSAVTVVGSIIEGLGTYWEDRWDKEREKDFDVQENWYAYLAHDSTPEPVGHRYVGRLVTSMYFELGMMMSTPLLLGGILAVGLVSDVPISLLAAVLVLIAAGGAVWFFHKEARDSQLALCKARKQLVERRRPR